MAVGPTVGYVPAGPIDPDSITAPYLNSCSRIPITAMTAAAKSIQWTTYWMSIFEADRFMIAPRCAEAHSSLVGHQSHGVPASHEAAPVEVLICMGASQHEPAHHRCRIRPRGPLTLEVILRPPRGAPARWS